MLDIEKPKDIHDKPAWCKYGEKVEEYFANIFCPSIGIHDVEIHPEKLAGNPYVVDLLHSKKITDLKTCHKPFFRAESKFGIPPEFAVSFDRKDYCRYIVNHSDVSAFFWLQWETSYGYGVTVQKTHALWKLHLSDIHKLVVDGRAKPNGLLKRGYKDDGYFTRNITTGNSMGNYVIDLRDFPYTWKGA